MFHYPLKNAPHSIYYIPNFIEPAQEEAIISSIDQEPKPKWKQLSRRRLQMWGGVPSINGMIPETIPQYLQTLMDMVKNEVTLRDSSDQPLDNPTFNHALVNEYNPGEGIDPHEDGPLYKNLVFILSLGSSIMLNIYPHPGHDKGELGNSDAGKLNEAIASLLLEPRSLFIFTGEVYANCYHGIDFINKDKMPPSKIINWHVVDQANFQIDENGDCLNIRKRRISITIREVLKLKKSVSKSFKFLQKK